MKIVALKRLFLSMIMQEFILFNLFEQKCTQKWSDQQTPMSKCETFTCIFTNFENRRKKWHYINTNKIRTISKSQPTSYTSPALSSTPLLPSHPLLSCKLGHPWHCLYLDVPSAALLLPRRWVLGFITHTAHRLSMVRTGDPGRCCEVGIWKFYRKRAKYWCCKKCPS